MNEQRRGDWIETSRGWRFYPLDPRPDEIDIRDIAHALSLLNRFTGHSREPISIAQHSCHVASLLPAHLRLWGLLHDASEAYTNDLSRPLKHLPELAPFREAEHDLSAMIYARFGLSGPEPAEVKWADNIMLKAEAKALMACRTETWGKWIDDIPDISEVSPVKLPIVPTWDWRKAERIFLAEFHLATLGHYADTLAQIDEEAA